MGSGGYLKKGWQKLVFPVEYKGGDDPKRGQDRKIGNRQITLSFHPLIKKGEDEEYCYA
jgi:hypothetical protein